jgi:hypothetical protein
MKQQGGRESPSNSRLNEYSSDRFSSWFPQAKTSGIGSFRAWRDGFWFLNQIPYTIHKIRKMICIPISLRRVKDAVKMVEPALESEWGTRERGAGLPSIASIVQVKVTTNPAQRS